ncbi:multidrug ABC transporter ATP-binding protein [Sphaerisporangium krabiense]|uniref:ABC-2 type transport system ATP-binding protein n=2 Tax=Sphaerisporangium krabiense TaxID=763782 RepID=A0A7W8ZCG9_9ACTN|nr:ABC-2 type transport system ATP-binding protein [Sphaerisporangium krabiense]GII60875.1 multidrug ABC transporter ATP-binding protein [Sphaerisporangium krabiense]
MDSREPDVATTDPVRHISPGRLPDQSDGDPVIETRGLRMRYGNTDVLHGVDLRVHRGEVLALLGPNGAGKTTTIEILEGFRGRSAGEARVLGTDPGHGDEAWRARLGIVLQSWRDHGRWRVRELLAHLGRYYTPYGTPGRPRPYDTGELLGLVGLTEQAETMVARLSGGQRRRLDVAVGLVGRPDLLFLDEPTVGFDPVARQDFHDLVRRLSDLEDTTILLTTHDLDEAERLADRIALLAGGRIVAEGSAAELAARVSAKAEVRYSKDGEHHAVSVEDATGYVRELFARHGAAIGDLEVRRPSLAEVYLAMVREFESGRPATAPGELTGVDA